MIYHGTITMENGAELPFELYPDDAPVTVENFVKLVKEGYYDGKTFHRVIKNFVSQGGCPYGTGAGDLGYTIPCETANNPHKHEDGSLSMAHRGKDTGLSLIHISFIDEAVLEIARREDFDFTHYGLISDAILDVMEQGSEQVAADLLEQLRLLFKTAKKFKIDSLEAMMYQVNDGLDMIGAVSYTHLYRGKGLLCEQGDGAGISDEGKQSKQMHRFGLYEMCIRDRTGCPLMHPLPSL